MLTLEQLADLLEQHRAAANVRVRRKPEASRSALILGLQELAAQGFVRARVDGQLVELD